jgi:hypothetical protein
MAEPPRFDRSSVETATPWQRALDSWFIQWDRMAASQPKGTVLQRAHGRANSYWLAVGSEKTYEYLGKGHWEPLE